MRGLGWVVALVGLMTAASAAARWREASSAHFVVYAEQSPKQLQQFAETLERYDATLRLLAGVPNNRVGKASRVTVFVMSDLVQLRRVFGARTSNVAGFYIARAEGPVAFAAVTDNGGVFGGTVLSSQTILLHEYAHHFTALNVGQNYPSWYREGFAEFAASSIFGNDGSVTIGGAAAHRVYGLRGGAVSIAKLVSADQPVAPADQDEFYARSWQLTHYLTFAPERKGQLDTYLSSVAGGLPRAEAATRAFGDIGKLERDARGYISGRQIPGLKLASTLIPISAVAIRELSDAENAAIPMVITSQRGVDEAQADAQVPQARALSARYPADAFVQRAVAEVEMDADNYPEAIAAADRVLAIKPDDVGALVFRGRALMDQAKTAKTFDELTWKEVRRWFTAANRADRNDPAPLIYYYTSFKAAGQEPTANAIAGLKEASRLAPQDGGLQATLARQMLASNDLPGARRQLALLGSGAHGRAAGQLAPVWEALAANDAPTALAAFDKATGPPTDTTAAKAQ